MRRKPVLAAIAGLACVAVGLAALPYFRSAEAQQNVVVQPPNGPVNPPANAAKGNAATLAVKKVILFTSGVGFFQREGKVEDNARIDLSFPVQDVNDLLKSLVLRDLDGGKISTVNYDSQDPIDKTLKSFAINLGGNPGFADILSQARGEKVTVSYVPPGGVQPLTMAGTIVSVEKKKQPINKDAATDVEYLNIWGEKGMSSIKLAEVVQVAFQNPALASELNRALDVVAQGHDTQKKTVSLQFTGKGKRNVQVGYVVEHPIWKTSYRLVLSKDAKPYLQGWAIVENPTNEDWSNVGLSLVSGRPVSFRMDLYQPQYVDRPLVQLQQFGNLKPITYEGDMESKQPAADKKQDKGKYKDKDKKGGEGKGPGAGLEQPAPPGGFPPGKDLAKQLEQSIPTMAQGVQLGDQFQYVINQPVSVARQKSALVPIVNLSVEGTRVSIFNEKSLAKFPMLGLKFKNTTPLHLMQGPITVFAEDSYAGDALIADLQPNEERLLSYAVDMATEVRTEQKKLPDPKVLVSLTKGIIYRTITLRDTKTYTVKNRSDHEKLVILEHPIRAPEFALVTPAKEPAKSQTFYRFELTVPADSTKSFPVVEEKKVLEQVVLTNQNTDALALLIQSTNITPAIKAALKKAVELRLKQAKTEGEIAKLNNKLKIIADEQARQRENMKVIPQSDPLYKKYLQKFNTQEEQIESLREQIEKLQATLEQQRQAYEDYVVNLTVKEEKE
jgi:hypothetical protein